MLVCREADLQLSALFRGCQPSPEFYSFSFKEKEECKHLCFSSYIVTPFFKTGLSISVISSRMLIIVSLKCSVSCLAFGSTNLFSCLFWSHLFGGCPQVCLIFSSSFILRESYQDSSKAPEHECAGLPHPAHALSVLAFSGLSTLLLQTKLRFCFFWGGGMLHRTAFSPRLGGLVCRN